MCRGFCWPTSRPAISIRTPSDHVFHALTQLIRASGLTVMLATHNMEIAARMDRRVTIRDGLIVEYAPDVANACAKPRKIRPFPSPSYAAAIASLDKRT